MKYLEKNYTEMTHLWLGGKKSNNVLDRKIKHPYAGLPCKLLVWRKRKALIEFADGYKMVVLGNIRRLTPNVVGNAAHNHCSNTHITNEVIMSDVQKKITEVEALIAQEKEKSASLFCAQDGIEKAKELLQETGYATNKTLIQEMVITQTCYDVEQEKNDKKVTDKYIAGLLECSEAKVRQYRQIWTQDKKIILLYIGSLRLARSFGAKNVTDDEFNDIVSLLEKHGREKGIAEFFKQRTGKKSNESQKPKKTATAKQELENLKKQIASKDDELTGINEAFAQYRDEAVKTGKRMQSEIEAKDAKIRELNQRYEETLQVILACSDYESMRTCVQSHLNSLGAEQSSSVPRGTEKLSGNVVPLDKAA